MRWHHLLAYLFGGAVVANFVPHFVNGVSGNPFQSPFASPPGVGLSSSTVNVSWSLFNLVLAYVLLVRVGSFDLKRWSHAVAFVLGFGAMALFLAHRLGPLHGGSLP